MDHRFTGPAFTLGVEEELMIVDPRTMELVSAVEEMIEAVPRETEGQVKPELLQSVLEIATDVCRNVGRGGRPARGPAPPGARDGRGEGAHDRLRGDASVREVGGPAHRGARALPRDRRRARVRRAPGAAVRPARARRHRRRRQGDPRRERHARPPSASCSRCRPTRPSGAARPTSWMSSRTPLFRLLPRVGIPPRFEGWTEYCERIEFMVAGRRDPRLHVPVVGRAPASQPGHRRGALLRRADAARAHDRDHRADPGDGEGALPSTSRPGRQLGDFPAELLEENKWLAARYGIARAS